VRSITPSPPVTRSHVPVGVTSAAPQLAPASALVRPVPLAASSTSVRFGLTPVSPASPVSPAAYVQVRPWRSTEPVAFSKSVRSVSKSDAVYPSVRVTSKRPLTRPGVKPTFQIATSSRPPV